MKNIPRNIRDVRLVLSDWDGVWTDGVLNYGPDGEISQRISIRDGMGVTMLREAGILVGIVTGRRSKIGMLRMTELRIDPLLISIAEEGGKRAACTRLIAASGVPQANSIFIGDDINDIPAFEVCAMSACPSDAATIVKGKIDLQLRSAGGAGAFREVADLILGYERRGF